MIATVGSARFLWYIDHNGVTKREQSNQRLDSEESGI